MVLVLFILLFVIIALVACKYIYFVIKRSRLLFKLKKANAKVTGTHKFWFLGTRGGEKCDFYVETEKKYCPSSCLIATIIVFQNWCLPMTGISFSENAPFLFRCRPVRRMYMLTDVGCPARIMISITDPTSSGKTKR